MELGAMWDGMETGEWVSERLWDGENGKWKKLGEGLTN